MEEPKIYGEVCWRKQRRKRQKVLALDLLMDYAGNSTLHGLRYIAEKGLSIVERLFWLLTFLISTALCFLLMRNVWIKWQTSPVIVSFSEQMVPVGQVPFPSITICPQIKSMATKFNYSREYFRYKKLHENSNETKELEQLALKLHDLSLVCADDSLPDIPTHTYANSSTIDNMFEAAPKVEDFIELCVWQNGNKTCESNFKRVLTSEGVCYNFNAVAADEIFRTENIQQDYIYLNTTEASQNWTVTEGYTNFDPHPYPRRGRENSATPDLEIILQMDPKDKDETCNALNKGYKIFVQNPADKPQDSLYYYAALPGQVSSLALKFNMISTSDTLKDYSPEVRQCYFPEDRLLKYFRIYTPNNCRLECLSNYTFQKCGCVWYDMPHNDSTQICTATQRYCVYTAQDEMTLQELKAELGADVEACRCLPSCYSVNYDAEILKTDFQFKAYVRAYEKLFNLSMSEYDSKIYSKVEIYFKEPQFVSMRRSELFGLTDFLANCGGLLGLFLGFSFLSLVEIGYFLTLRYILNTGDDHFAHYEEIFKNRTPFRSNWRIEYQGTD